MTLPVVTPAHVDAVYDAMIQMRLVAQTLSEGEVREEQLGDISWILGSTRKRLEPVIELLENFEWHQTHGDKPQASTDDVLELGSEVLALATKLTQRRLALLEKKHGQ